MLSLSVCKVVIQRCLCVTPLSFCLMAIVNEKLLNLEKTTSSVLSVFLLIYSSNKKKKKVFLYLINFIKKYLLLPLFNSFLIFLT